MRSWFPPLEMPWLWLLALISLSGVIHITAVLSLPYLAERDAWARLSAISSENQLYVLPPTADNPPLPMMSSDVAYAFCRFDLTQKNVLLKPSLPESAWMLAISTRYGENFYFITGAEAKRRDLRLLLVPRSRLAQETAAEKNEEGEEQIIVISPSETGVALIHAPIRGQEFLTQTVGALQLATCEQQKETDARLLAGADEPREPAIAPPPAPQRKSRRGTRRYRE